MRTGLHANTTRDHAKLIDYYRRSQANVFKTLSFDNDLFQQLRAVRPGLTIIGRIYVKEQSLDNRSQHDFINQCVNLARGSSLDYIEGYNEAFQDGSDMERYSSMEIDRMKALEATRNILGKPVKAIIGCFSTGQPELWEWPRFKPAVDYAIAHGHALGLHEYSGPVMQWMAGANQWDFANNRPFQTNDACITPNAKGFLTLRYRQVLDRLRELGCEVDDLGIFITESGIDDVTPRPGPQGKGYKDYVGTEWDRINGISDYATQRYWYSWQLSHDKQIKGVTDFGWDTADPTWRSFDLSTDSAMLEKLIAVEQSLPILHFGDSAPPRPVPTIRDSILASASTVDFVRLNPNSAFQKRAIVDGYWLTSNEYSTEINGRRYQCQRAERAVGANPKWGVYYCEIPNLNTIYFVSGN